MGWIRFTEAGPEPSIHLSRAGVEELLLHTAGSNSLTRFTHETLVARALGRALSHELGHYLLRSPTHTSRGLMRAAWSSEDFFGIHRSRFELTAAQQHTAAAHAKHDTLTH